MNYEMLKDLHLCSYVITSDSNDQLPIEVTETATSGLLVANIKLDGESNKLYVTNEALSAAVGIPSIVDAIQQLQTTIQQLQQKISALPFNDANGRFYMTDGLSSSGEMTYRMLSTYVEPETNAPLIAASDRKYKRENDQFIII